MAEVSDDELKILRNAYDFVVRANADPKAKPHLEAAVKIFNPDVQTEAEIVQAAVNPALEEMRAQQQAILDRFAAMDEAAKTGKESQAAADMQAAFDRLAKGGYTEEGIAKIKQIMVDRSVPDPESAAALFDKLNPPAPAEQPGWTPDRWNYDETAGGPTTKELFANEDSWSDKMVGHVLADIRGKQAA